jgi:hypothetical protein
MTAFSLGDTLTLYNTTYGLPTFVRFKDIRLASRINRGVIKKRGRKKIEGRPSLSEQHRAKQLAKKEELETLYPVAQLSCGCKKQNHLGDISNDRLRDLRDRFFAQPTEVCRKEFLKQVLRPPGSIQGDHVKQFKIGGEPVCWKACTRLFGVSNCLLTCVACTQSGKFNPHNGGTESFRQPASKALKDFQVWDYVTAWLGQQKKMWEMQPDRAEVCGPWKNRRACWNSYKKEVGKSFGLEGEWPDCSEAYFFQIWDAEHPDLKCKEFTTFMVGVLTGNSITT